MTSGQGIKSFREITRFIAEGERGVPHTVVERGALLTAVTFTANYQAVQNGVRVYYSATSGDVLTQISEDVFVGRRGELRLTRVRQKSRSADV